ncbi:MAG: GNAT family N-acetyltransferase [Parachlamydiales bacterium]
MTAIREIVRAEPSDAPLLTDLAFRSKLYWGYPKRLLKPWRPIIEMTPELIQNFSHFKAIDAQGNCLACYGLTGEGDHRILRGFWVAPEAIGKGIGRKLYEHMIGTAKQEGAHTVEWDSDPYAAPFYPVMGQNMWVTTSIF